tara:strand:- start:1013 stop:1249 length:237 start_codon:yes stop_codon:yes gene_type:complete
MKRVKKGDLILYYLRLPILPLNERTITGFVSKVSEAGMVKIKWLDSPNFMTPEAHYSETQFRKSLSNGQFKLIRAEDK